MSDPVQQAPRFGGYTLEEAVSGLLAFDGGAIDSGFDDADIREAVERHLLSLEGDTEPGTFRVSKLASWASRYVRDRYLSESAMRDGYSIADAKAFIEWVEDLTGWSF